MSGPWDEFQRVDSAPARPAPAAPSGGRVLVPDNRTATQDAADAQARAQSQATDATRTGIAVESNTRDEATTGIKNPQALRTEFDATEESRIYRTMLPAYATAINSRNDGMGDLNALYAYVKALDPIGAVRGEDVENIRSSVPAAQSIATRLGFQLDANGMLSVESRNRLLREFHNRLVQANRLYTMRRRDFEGLAVSNGIDPQQVVGTHPGNIYNEQIRTFLSQNPDASSIPIRRGPDNRPGMRPDDPTGPVSIVTGAESALGPSEAPTSNRLTNAQAEAYGQFQLQNRGRLTGDMLNAWAQQNGLGGLSNANEVADYVNRTGEPVTQFDYGPADEQRNAALNAEIAARDRLNGGAPSAAGNADRLISNGFTMNLADEGSGVAGGVIDALGGGSFTEGYSRERDIQRLQDQRARDQLGGWGTALEVGGSLLSARAPRFGPQILASTGQMVRDGAIVGGVAGFGSGEGLDGSLRSAALSAAAGAGLGGVVGRLANGPRNVAPERQAFLDAAARNPEIPVLSADIPGATGAQVATGLAERSLAGGMITNARDAGGEALGKLADDVASRVGTVGDNVAAGDSAIAGANRYVADSQSRVSRAYQAIPIAGDVNAELASTRTAFADLSRRYASNPELQAAMRDPRLSRWQQAIEQGRLSWDDLKAFRTDIGEMIEGPVLSEAGSKSRLRQLYGALTADMEATARAQGPQALAAFKAANRAAADRFSNIERVITPVLGNDGQRGAEAAFARINSWAAAKGGDHVRLARFMRSIPADDASTIRATIISRLGEATPGANNAAGDAFSPATFLSNWNRMSERARSVLFDGAHRQAIDDLAAFAGGMKQGKRFANNSETSRGSMLLATLGLTYANPVAGASSAAGQVISSAVLASPKMAHWIMALSRKPNTAAITAHINRLPALAAAEPTLARDIISLQQMLTQRLGEIATPTRAAAASSDREQDVNNAR